MSATVTKLQLLTQFQVTENPGSQPAGTGITSFFNDLDQALFLTSTTTPAPTMFAVYKTTISGGGYNIDATAAQGSNGTVDATGKKLLALAIVNPAASAGSVTVSTGGTNGYTMSSVVVPSGGFAIVYLAATTIAVDGTHKQINVAGTNGDTPELALVFG